MARTAELKVRVDQNVRDGAAELHVHWGLSQSVDCDGLPFELSRRKNLSLAPGYQALRPQIVDGAALVPADWDDPEDEVYD
jgi:antitoxin component of RelBE/YafQ-DinJ toxin-antitoxin module